ncbi:MAG: hypothetical protein JWN96_463 [Mycobacterium sp.]|nr:hypothetical protein [Mycobacterium sp.]
MSVVIAWLRLELRRRWRSLVVVALLVAVSVGTVMTALEGARRNASAIERLRSRTLPATAAVLANTPNFDWRAVRRLPEVAAFTTIGPTFALKGFPAEAVAEPALLPSTARTIERPVIASGRMFDADSSDEGVVPAEFASRFHIKVGDTVSLRLPTPKELMAAVLAGSSGHFTGPQLRIRVVGTSISHWFGDSLLLAPGVTTRYAANLVGSGGNSDRPLFANALVRLRGGAADMSRFRADVARVTGRPDLEVIDVAVWEDHPAQQQSSFAARCLVAFGAAAFAAALFLVGQAISRYVALNAFELRSLRGLGLSQGQGMMAAAAGPTASGAIGVLLGGVGAILASQLFPIGEVATAEPHPGISVDWLVLGLVGAGAVLLVLAGALTAARFQLSERSRPTGRRSAVASAMAGAGFPAPVVIGTRLALESGRGRSSLPVRPALIGATLGVLGVLAALTFSGGVSDAASHPERFGQTYQLSAEVGNDGQDFGPVDTYAEALRGRPEVTGVDNARIAVASSTGGKSSITLYAYNVLPKPLDVVVTSGRMPRSADEVLLAPQSLQSLHASVGDRVVLAGSKGSSTFTVTGSGLVPQGFHNNYADGGWLTDSGFDTLFKGYKFHLVYVSVAASEATPDAGQRLSAALGRENPKLADFQLSSPDPLTQLAALRDVRVLPRLLGAFLAVLGVGAVGHALVTAVRRRSGQLAVLRAIGMTPWQCRTVALTHATVIGLVGLIFGLPLGLALGRIVWRTVADYTPFQYVPPLDVTALLLLIPATLLAVNLLAIWPGRQAGKLHLAQVLRAE